jgi:hypothetical protein
VSLRDKKRLQKRFLSLKNPTRVAALFFIGGQKFAIFSLLKNQINFCYTALNTYGMHTNYLD